MITVQLSSDEFESDVRAIIQAFYPEQFLYVHCKESKVKQQNKPEGMQSEMTVCLYFGEEKIALEIPEYDIRTDITTVAQDRHRRRNDVKALLYQELVKLTGKRLPWGTLTGIRPIKIFTRLREQGMTDQDICQKMAKDYLISKEKSLLGIQVANREQQLLRSIPAEDAYSLYVHIPFCPTTCLYCSFTSFAAESYEQKMKAYVDALLLELDYVASVMKGQVLTTIYFGGGTPTTLPACELQRLIGHIRKRFDTTQVLEFTVEAGRPDSITREKLSALKEGGVTRISINPQTMQDKTLKLIGRNHTVQQVKDAFALARQMGFDNINMDLIMGLPNETITEVKDTLKQIARLAPDSLTIHSLAIKHNSRLNLDAQDYVQLQYASAEHVQQAMKLAGDYAYRMQQQPYYLYRQKNIAGNLENIGYSLPGKEGLYNVLIIEERQSILAVGAGAITKICDRNKRETIRRIENVKNVDQYIDRIDEMIKRKHRISE